ncbi:MAG: RHS repeat-associated core domain-containing protein [Lentisphaerae bacterium]|nr:RHS repeat-associated core domain-containing protein [Lentisphaerota bacterium]
MARPARTCRCWGTRVAARTGRPAGAAAVLFAGYILDAESGLYAVRRRVYHPTLGRWLQRDPAGYADGANLYAYCSADPATLTDPLGLCGGDGLAPWYGTAAKWLRGYYDGMVTILGPVYGAPFRAVGQAWDTVDGLLKRADYYQRHEFAGDAAGAWGAAAFDEFREGLTRVIPVAGPYSVAARAMAPDYSGESLVYRRTTLAEKVLNYGHAAVEAALLLGSAGIRLAAQGVRSANPTARPASAPDWHTTVQPEGDQLFGTRREIFGPTGIGPLEPAPPPRITPPPSSRMTPPPPPPDYYKYNPN